MVSPSATTDVLKVEFRKATIVAFRETTFQLSTTLGTLPNNWTDAAVFIHLAKIQEFKITRQRGAVLAHELYHYLTSRGADAHSEGNLMGPPAIKKTDKGKKKLVLYKNLTALQKRLLYASEYLEDLKK